MTTSLYLKNNLACSKATTLNYSTSFSFGIKLLHRDFHYPIYAIYGFVRYADEIVDTFFENSQQELLDEFKADTYKAIERKISSNPILDSLQWVVHKYQIEIHLIEAFLHSMEMDLTRCEHDQKSINEYIYGSAEVVGLMCLRVFCENDNDMYSRHYETARSLGAAFQKVNFLRDIKADYYGRGRIYFPGVEIARFTDAEKRSIEEDIQNDFDHALTGIKSLNKKSRKGVYLAYIYYQKLLRKIIKAPASELLNKRYRISNFFKLILMVRALFY
jgi:phytoene/squalene synthetase